MHSKNGDSLLNVGPCIIQMEMETAGDRPYLMHWVDTIDAWAHMETVPTFFMMLDFVDKNLSLRLDNESYDDETGEMVTDWTLWDLAGDVMYAIHLDALRDIVEDATSNVHALVAAVQAEDKVHLSIFKNGVSSDEFDGTFESSLMHVCCLNKGRTTHHTCDSSSSAI